jgi:serine/threonine-protein kinase
MAIDPRRLEIGNRVGTTKWVVCGKLGEGGMGIVVEVVKPPGIRGAMKVMHPELAERREYVDAFLNEVRIQAGLEHEHIVRVIDSDELEDGTLYFVMELLSGCTLRDLMRNYGRPLPPGHVQEIICQVCEALDRCHAEDIVHRDLKPENVFLNTPDKGRTGGKAGVKLCDWGISVLAHGKRLRGTIGTPKYMSPEQCRGERVTARSDIYSLAVMTYEMLTGKFPWEVPDDAEKMRDRHLNEAPTPPIDHAPWMPVRVNALLLRALSKAPEDRPRSAIEFGNELEELGFCPSGSGVDVNITEPMLGTLTELVSTRGVIDRGDDSMLRSAGTETARGMTPPPMAGRSLELAPRGTGPMPNASPVRTADTKPVAGSEWPSQGEPPRPAGSEWPTKAEGPRHPPVSVSDPSPAVLPVQETGRTSTPVHIDRSRDEVVVTIPRRRMIQAAVVGPVLVAVTILVVALVVRVRGVVAAATNPAPSTGALTAANVSVMPPSSTNSPPASTAASVESEPAPTAPASLPPPKPATTSVTLELRPAPAQPAFPPPQEPWSRPPPPPPSAAKPPPVSSHPALPPDDGHDLLSMPH